MNTEIDLDTILEKYERAYSKEHAKIKGSADYNLKHACIEAIHQALVLTSKKARTKTVESYYNHEYHYHEVIDEQSILDIIKLVK